MKILKKLLRPRVIVWAALSIVLVAAIIVVNNVAVNRFGPTLDQIFGGKKAIIDKSTKRSFGEEFDTKDEARAHGDEVVKEICEEGMVLLKNEGNFLPLQKNAQGKINVSVFGKNSVNLVYGGSGSAAPDKSIEKKTIFQSLEAAGISYNETLKAFYESKDSGNGRSSNPSMASGGAKTLKTGETEISKYTSAITDSYAQYKDAALVVFSRIAGENWDLPRFADDTNERHYLELDNNERDLLRHIHNQGFEHIILLMNSSNYIDLGFLKEETNPTDYNDFGKYVDGAIVIGSPGANGIMALGEILTGLKNGQPFSPSGHTVDTVYTKYEEDPTYQNFGGYQVRRNDADERVYVEDGDRYLKPDGSKSSYYFVYYEEDIYQGYRYYETRGSQDAAWYNSHVVYPFGHGLSYTTFSEEIVEVTGAALDPENTFDVKVKVTNTGAVPGKQVVQLYAEAPYDGKLEKPYKVLAGFAKTKELAPAGNGAASEDTVTITVNPYDFASFDCYGLNDVEGRGWELDAGDYTFHVATDAHNDIASGTFVKNLATGYQWTNDPKTGNKVEPLFDDVTNGMFRHLSRSDFAGTFPKNVLYNTEDVPAEMQGTLKVGDEYEPRLKLTAALNESLGSFESILAKEELEAKYTEVPKMNAGLAVPFEELIGKPYNDDLWEQFLDQMTFEEMMALFNNGCYSTIDIQRLGIPKTTSVDGPTGIVSFLGTIVDVGQKPPVYGCCYYCSECLVAQTYNVELAEKEGFAVGNEAVVGDERGEGLAYPGWYAPAVNIHRSPFSGRNTEYYSEDAFLNGKFAAEVIRAVQQRGVYVNIKHYALNDQETHRDSKGIATWCDEQAMRENYLRAFEIAVKESDPHGLMTSFNRIGTEWAGGSYRLITKILRDEWGFVGSVICDYKTNFYMDAKQMLYGGGDIALCSDKDIFLSTTSDIEGGAVSKTSPVDTNLLRRSAHNNLYALVNSAAMRYVIKGYKPATWRVIFTAAEWGIVGLLVVWGFFMIFTSLRAKPKDKKAKKAKKEPEVAEEAVSEKQAE